MKKSLFTLFVWVALTGVSFAATRTWDDDSSNHLWSTAQNWSGDTVPVPYDVVVFDGTCTNNCSANIVSNNLASITLASTYTGTVTFATNAVAGGMSLTVTGDITVASGNLVFTGNTTTDSIPGTAENDGMGYTLQAANITIASNASMNANGKGFGTSSGPGEGGDTSGDGKGGGGAGYGGTGGDGNGSGAAGGTTYGLTTQPTSLGSGGGSNIGYSGGGCGGGAIKINVTNVLTVNGNIRSDGDDGGGPGTYGEAGGGGSGGSVWIAATTITGNGSITARGGNGGASTRGGGGGGGRIAIYTTTDNFSGSTSAYGGSGYQYGASGTIYKKLVSQSNGDLTIDNNGNSAGYNGNGAARLNEGTHTFDNLYLANSGNLEIHNSSITLDLSSTTISGDGTGKITNNGKITISNDFTITDWILAQNPSGTLTNLQDLTIGANGTLTHSANRDTEVYWLDISLNSLEIVSGGAVSVNGLGYAATYGPGKGSSTSGDYKGGGGAGYGGTGGGGSGSAAGGTTYGLTTQPTSLGSGGGSNIGYSGGGCGGGAIKINVTNVLTVNGNIRSDGDDGGGPGTYGEAGGGGSGGSVWIAATTITGNGSITARGGNGGASTTGGGGGGGRIKIEYITATGDNTTNTAYGGSGNEYGGAGTIVYKSLTQNFGDLTVDNNNINGNLTPIPTNNFTGTPPTLTFDSVTVTNRARLVLPTNMTLAVNGDFSNISGSFTAYTNSSMVLASTNQAAMSGSTTFYNLTSATAGKVINFKAGSTNIVNGKLTLTGVTLNSTAPGNWWYLNLANAGEAYQDVSGVTVRDSNATNGQTIIAYPFSKDEGHNVNWTFLQPAGTVFSIQ